MRAYVREIEKWRAAGKAQWNLFGLLICSFEQQIAKFAVDMCVCAWAIFNLVTAISNVRWWFSFVSRNVHFSRDCYLFLYSYSSHMIAHFHLQENTHNQSILNEIVERKCLFSFWFLEVSNEFSRFGVFVRVKFWVFVVARIFQLSKPTKGENI